MNKIGIIGGGAAGFFAAITCAESNPENEIIILEKSSNLLSKVKVSGGGRCNVTNACFDIDELLKNYPRGFKELRSVFHKFNSADTIKWFTSRGVELKTENDKRIFPVSNKSETIINCFLTLAKKHNIHIIKNFNVKSIRKNEYFIVTSDKNEEFLLDKLLIATGGGAKEEFYLMFEKIGHTIILPVPSLFTFNLANHTLKGLEGISMDNVSVKIKDSKFIYSSALLITHWGLSGPVILKLSAFAARYLNDKNYNFDIEINWIPEINNVKEELIKYKTNNPSRIISIHSLFKISLRLWKKLTKLSGINEELKWKDISKEKINSLSETLTKNNYSINGKSTFKEEFVTTGGIKLKEVDFKTMESKICKDLYFAGEVLDIDGITGGFNFQSAWSTGFVAGIAMAEDR